MPEEIKTYTQEQLNEKCNHAVKIGAGIGITFIGVGLLFDKKIDKTKAVGIIGAGVLFTALMIVFKKIDDMPNKV